MKTCECFLKETHIFILTTLFKLFSGASKTAPSPDATFSLCLIFLGFPAVFQLFGHSLTLQIFFVLNLCCANFPLTSFSSTFGSHDSVFHILFFSLDSNLKGPTRTKDSRNSSPILVNPSHSCWMSPHPLSYLSNNRNSLSFFINPAEI